MVSSATNTNLGNINIKVDNHTLSKVENIKFLSVNIDEKLTWKPHLQHLFARISQITGILYRIRN